MLTPSISSRWKKKKSPDEVCKNWTHNLSLGQTACSLSNYLGRFCKNAFSLILPAGGDEEGRRWDSVLGERAREVPPVKMRLYHALSRHAMHHPTPGHPSLAFIFYIILLTRSLSSQQRLRHAVLRYILGLLVPDSKHVT